MQKGFGNKESVVISGKREDTHNRIWVDGNEIFPDESLKIRNHSPDGFNWGYGGSGPAQAALAICLVVFGTPAVAQALYQVFKFRYVGHWQDDFTVVVNFDEFVVDNKVIYDDAMKNNDPQINDI